MLAAGTAAQVSFSVVGIGLPALAPALRDEFGLTLGEVGVLLSALWFGATFTLLPWGLVADRIGERAVLATGLGACGIGFAAAAFADGFPAVVGLLAAAGAAGASVNSASGRAVMAWFPLEQRGLALGIRQAAIPLGGGLAAVVLPPVEHAGGIEAAFLFIAALCVITATIGAVVLRGGPVEPPLAETVPWTIRDTRLWRLCAGSGLYLVGQISLIGFVVLYLYDERGWSDSEAALVLAAIQVLAAGARIGVGAWSDRVGARLPPLRRIGFASCVGLAAVAALIDAPTAPLVIAFVLAGTASMMWNGLSFAAAAELGGRARSGAAIGFQQTALSAAGLFVPIGFAAAVSVADWQAAFALAAAFPLIGVGVLWTLADRV